jgi:hypothetical protein
MQWYVGSPHLRPIKLGPIVMKVKYEFLPYVDIVIYIGPYLILETWPPIYRGQEGTM